MQYQIPLVKPQFQQGATVQRTDPVPPPNQPDLARYSALQIQRYLVAAPVQIHQGAPVQQQYIFPPNQPALKHPRVDIDRAWLWTGPEQMVDGATVQATHPTPPVGQPELCWFTILQRNRFEVQATPNLDVSAITSPQTYLFPPAQPEFTRYRPDINRAWTWIGPDQMLDGATVQEMAFSSYTAIGRQNYRMVVLPRLLDQAAAVVSFGPLPALSQPDSRYYRPDVNRSWTWVGPEQMVDGATLQQQYLFPPNQPEMRRWTLASLMRAQLEGPTAQFDGATVQQTYVFVPGQPDPARVALYLNQPRYMVGADTQIDQGATLQQSYEFAPAQPDLARFSAAQRNRWIVDPVRRTDGAGTVQPQTYEFFPNQPELRAFALRSNAKTTFTGPTPLLEGATVQQLHPVFDIDQPTGRYYQRAPQAPVAFPQPNPVVSADLFPLAQPEPRYYVRSRLGEVIASRNETVQQMHPVPGVSLPDLARYLAQQRNRRVIDATTQVHQGPTRQQTYIFPPDQPVFVRFARNQYNTYFFNLYQDIAFLGAHYLFTIDRSGRVFIMDKTGRGLLVDRSGRVFIVDKTGRALLLDRSGRGFNFVD